MSEQIEGGCFCGSVRYRFPTNDYRSSNCHCSMCRSISGAPYVAWMAVPSQTSGPIQWEGPLVGV